MTVVDGLTFPDVALWLADADILNSTGEALLDVVLAALDAIGARESYTRTVVSHGLAVPVEPGSGGQIGVVCPKVALGRAGEDQYQFTKGSTGKFGFHYASYTVRLTRPWPIRQGQQAVGTVALAEARQPLWRDAYVAFQALVALSLGGVTGTGLPTWDEMIVGPMQAADPAGGQASYEIAVAVQM